MLNNLEYEKYLKDASLHQIKKDIRDLDKRILSFKEQIVKAQNDDQKRDDLLNRLNDCRYKYDLAIKYYEEKANKPYINQKEDKNSQFNELLDKLNRLIYLEENLINGCRQISYRIENEHIFVEHKNNYLFNTASNNDTCLNISKAKFIDRLKELEIGKWKKSYKKDENKKSDHRWRVKLYIDGEDEIIHFSGENDYPYNFKEFKELLCIE